MRRSLLVSNVLAVLLAGGAAQAADLATKMPVKAPPVQAFSWTGFYIGIEAGYGWAKNDFSNSYDPLNPTTLQVADASYNLDGGFVGGQIGYNYQFANNIVLGVEADVAWADISGSGSYFNGVASSCIQSNDPCSSKIDALGNITARLGYAFDHLLVYAKGGAAWASFSQTAGFTDPLGLNSYQATSDSTRWGWTIGAGAEYAVTNNWSVKVEYNYADFGNSDVTFNFVPGGITNPYVATVSQNLQTLKAGINYRF